MSDTTKQVRAGKEPKQAKQGGKQNQPTRKGRSSEGLARQQARKIRNLVTHSHLTPQLAADVVAKRITLVEASNNSTVYQATQDRRYARKLRIQRTRRERWERYHAAVAQANALNAEQSTEVPNGD